MKNIFRTAFVAFVAAISIAHAQPGPGPGPQPSPWILNGSSISYGGCVLVPATVAGGCQGNGSLNVTSLFQGGVRAATLSGIETLTNKTLTAPTISSILNSGTLTLPATTDTLVGRATTDTLTNKTLSAASILSPSISGGTAVGLTSLGIRNAGTGAFDLTIAHNGTMTAPRTLTFNVNDAARTLSLSGNLTLGANLTTTGGATTFALGATGRTYTFPDAADTVVLLTQAQTLTNKTLTAPVIATIVNTGTLTLPTSTDTLVGRATTDTLTNKTLTSPAINTGTISGGTVDNAVIGGTTRAAVNGTTGNFNGNLTTNVTGSTQCLQANSSGVVSGTGAVCAGAQVWTQTAFTSSGTFTTPVGSTTNTIYHYKLWAGGGGSAGNAVSDANYGTEGGGGGQYCEGTFTGVAASTGITVTIGAAGTAGTNAPTAGGNGGNTTLGSPVSITCHGGNGGRVATVSIFSGAAGGTGASGAAIDINGYSGTGFNGEGGQGGGSPMGGGIGGKWLQSALQNAWPGQGFGAGAGGSRATGGGAAFGAAGTAGYALIERVAN